MRLKDGQKRWVVARETGYGKRFELRRQDTAKAKARVESRAHRGAVFVVHPIDNPVPTYAAYQGHGSPLT